MFYNIYKKKGGYMATTQLGSSHSKFTQVVEDQSFEKDIKGVSEAALEAADAPPSMESTARKVAYYWVKATPEDEVINSEYSKEGREACIGTLKMAGYDVVLLQGNREFLEHTAKDPTHPDLLLIHGHGNPWQLEDFEVAGDRIVSTDPTLSKSERVELIERVDSILDEGVTVGLKSCATGNKSVENNFACTASKTWTKAKVMAFQESVYGPPILHLEKAEDGSGAHIKHLRSGCNKLRSLETAVTYENGVETSGQKALRVPKVFREYNQHLINRAQSQQRMQRIQRIALSGAMIAGGAAACIYLSPYSIVDMTTSTLSSLL